MKIAIGICRHLNAHAVSPPLGSATLSDARDDTFIGNDNTNPEGGAAVNLNPAPTPIVTITIADLQAIQQKIADLEAAQYNTYCRRQSNSESDYKRAPKRSNLKKKALDEY